MILHANAGKVDADRLEGLLRSFGVLRAWQIFTTIAVSYLGLPESECPLYSPSDKKKACKILSIIMKEGNFGKFASAISLRPDGYFRGKFHSFRVISRRMLTLLPIDPSNVLKNYRTTIAGG